MSGGDSAESSATLTDALLVCCSNLGITGDYSIPLILPSPPPPTALVILTLPGYVFIFGLPVGATSHPAVTVIQRKIKVAREKRVRSVAATDFFLSLNSVIETLAFEV